MRAWLFAISVVVVSHGVEAAPDTPPELKVTGPDAAQAVYAEKCANGGNSDEANRNKFVELMLANPKSKLAQAKATLYKNLSGEPHDDVVLTDWVQTFHDRDGCGSSHNSYSAILETVTGGNTNHTVARQIVTIDDDDDSGVRKLSLRSIRPISVRDENR
jgi:hypothetical protein